MTARITAAKPAVETTAFEDDVSRIRGWIAALGVAGALAAIGFIARFAREQFQGVPGADWSVSELSIQAGRFVVDSFVVPVTFFFNYVPYHWFTDTAAVLLLTASVGVFWWTPRGRHKWLVHASALLVLICTLVYVFLEFEVPTFPLQAWFAGGIPSAEQDFGRGTFVNRRAWELSRTLVASRLESNDDRKNVAMLGSFQLSREEAKATIERHYSYAILVCALGWLYFLLSSGSLLKGRARVVMDSGRLVAVLLLLAVTCLVPYVYGKLIDSSTLPKADIGYTESAARSEKGKELKIEAVAASASEVPVLSDTEKMVTILSIHPQEGKLSKVIEIPRDHLLYLHYWGTIDPLPKLVRSAVPPSAGPPVASPGP
jgi:hypothetical protein